jgi:hypothetical protein
MTTIREIGARRELFVDDALLDALDGVRLQVNPPQRREVVLETNGTAECTTSYYYNLFEDNGTIRLYYRGNAPSDQSEEQTVNYAESTDGVHFTRPVLNLVDFQGSTANNVVYQGWAGHNFHVFRDDNPACDPAQRYKAVGGPWEKLYGFVSPDGLRWSLAQEEPLPVAGAFDSLNVAFWDARRGQYRLFSRYCKQPGWFRAIQSCSSPDFRHWSTPVPHDYGAGVEDEQLYTNATVLCPGAEHLLLAFPKRFLPERTRGITGAEYRYASDGVSDAVFMSSRDGEHWHRFREAWVRPGLDERNWTHRNNLVACGIACTSPTEWSMYIGEHYGWTSNRLRRLAVRPWGFAGLHADYAGGVVTTHPLIFSGNTLRLNAATSAAGAVQVELLDAAGTPIPGFTRAEMAPWFGDELDAVMRWADGANLGRLTGQPVRLRMYLQDADVYALRFNDGLDE